MSAVIDKIKQKMSKGEKEQEFTTQPHPANPSDPTDPSTKNPGEAGLGYGEFQRTANAKGPFIPDQEMQANMEQPKTREELQARAAELNQ